MVLNILNKENTYLYNFNKNFTFTLNNKLMKQKQIKHIKIQRFALKFPVSEKVENFKYHREVKVETSAPKAWAFFFALW